MERRTVLVIANNMAWIIGTMAQDLERVLAPEWDVIFFSTSEMRRQGEPGVQRLHQLARSVDLVHCLDPYLYRFAPLPLERPLITTILHVDGWADEEPNTAGDLIVTISPEWHAFVAGHTDTPSVMVPLAVDTRHWRPVAGRSRTRRSLGVRGDQPVIGFFATAGGNDTDRKGVAVATEALTSFAAKHPDRAPVFVVTGSGWDGLASELSQRGISVRNEGYVSKRRLRRLYGALDLYLMCSSVEGGPAPVLESMACGTPCVATPVGIVPIAIVSGANGIIVPVGDPPATAAAIRQLVADELERTKLGTAARATVTESFEVARVYRRFVELYDLAIAEAVQQRGVSIAPSSRRVTAKDGANADVVLQDQLYSLLHHRHSLSAITDLAAPLTRLARAHAWRRLASGLWKAAKFESVSRSSHLRRIAHRSRRS